MRIIVIGGTGTIGTAVVKELKSRHEIIVAGHTQGDAQVDIENADSIEKLYQSAGTFNAVIMTTGKVHFADFSAMRVPLSFHTNIRNSA